MCQGDPGLVPGLDLVSLCAALYDLKPDQNNFTLCLLGNFVCIFVI